MNAIELTLPSCSEGARVVSVPKGSERVARKGSYRRWDGSLEGALEVNVKGWDVVCFVFFSTKKRHERVHVRCIEGIRAEERTAQLRPSEVSK